MLRAAKRHVPSGARLLTKTSIMLGLGETAEEVVEAMCAATSLPLPNPPQLSHPTQPCLSPPHPAPPLNPFDSFSRRDLRDAGVDVVTFGQYLRPTEHHLAVVEYVTPQQFEWYREQAS